MAGLTEMHRDGTEPGLWINHRWEFDTAGLYAVIIGVTKYKHLEPGADQAPKTYGFPTLAVSALTAFRLFQWLTEEYYVKECPVARCWLLLSPSEEELQFEPKLRDYTSEESEATFENCERAIGFWNRELHNLDDDVASLSRSYLFFSGHGLESHREKQILLPADYLAPPNHNINKAISTQNLRYGLASSPVSRQFFFVDACRNDHDELRRMGLDGTRVLTEQEGARWQTPVAAPVMYATASGSSAWQQSSPNHGLSLFGQALLDGLRGSPNIELKCSESLCAVRIFPLQVYVKSSVVEQLAEADSSYQQPVRLGGDCSENVNVTFLRASDQSNLANVPVRPEPTGTALTAAGAIAAKRQLDNTVFTHLAHVGAQEESWPTDYSIAHNLFLREPVTLIWMNRLRVLSLPEGEAVAPDRIKLIEVAADRASMVYRVELTFEQDAAGYWLELNDHTGHWHAVTLPTDNKKPLEERRRPFNYTLTIDFSDDGSRILSMDATLADSNEGPVSLAVKLLKSYQTNDVGTAVEEFQAGQLQELVRRKGESPLAAIIASTVLLRANRLDLLHDWLTNLTHLFPELPDPPVLLAEKLLRERDMSGACDQMLLLLERGLPFTAECVGYAAGILDRLAAKGITLTDRQTAGLRQVRTRMDQLLTRFRPGGLFVTQTGLAQDERP